MNAKRNAHPTVGAVEQAQAGNVLADGYSRDYCTSNPVTGQLKISDFLGKWRKNALTMRELRKFIDADSRTIRLQIETERRSGIPILSGHDGYWLAADPAEAQMFARSMLHRSREIARTAMAVEKGARLL